MSSVFSHERAQGNDAGHLIDENVFKTTRLFHYQWFRVSTLQANANKPFILSDTKRTTGGSHLENAFEMHFQDDHLPEQWKHETIGSEMTVLF